MRKGDDDDVAGSYERGQVALGLGQPAGGDGRALRFESMPLASRQLGELDCAAETEFLAELLCDDATRFGRLPDEVRCGQRHDEVGGRRPRLLLDPRFDEIEAAFGRRVDDGLLERIQGALREGRERAHRFDFVAEELEAHGLPAGRRKDVHDPSADGELAALLRLLDALVAREREALGELLHAGLVAHAQADRLRPGRPGRDALDGAQSRGADEPAAGENLERPRTFPDEMRRRLEAACPAHTA